MRCLSLRFIGDCAKLFCDTASSFGEADVADSVLITPDLVKLGRGHLKLMDFLLLDILVEFLSSNLIIKLLQMISI